MTQVCLNLLAYGRTSGNPQRTDVRGPSGSNATPAMMLGETAGDSLPEALSLAHVQSTECVRGRPSAKDVDPRDRQVDRANGVELELVTSASSADPKDR